MPHNLLGRKGADFDSESNRSTGWTKSWSVHEGSSSHSIVFEGVLWTPSLSSELISTAKVQLWIWLHRRRVPIELHAIGPGPITP